MPPDPSPLAPGGPEPPTPGRGPDRPRPTNRFTEFPLAEIEQSIPGRFERIATLHGGRRAVKAGPRELTYAELNRAANRIARAILARGGGADEPVALLLEHGLSLVAAILGVLKAGRIYLPLDPSYPAARLAYVLEDAGAGLVVTSAGCVARARSLAGTRRLLLELDELDAADGNLAMAIQPDAPAYVLYTSGSTGRPKGVVQSHRGALWDIREYTNTLHISPDDRMTLLYSGSVNGAVRGIFGALLNGASLYPYDVRERGLNGLAELLRGEEITFYHSVPSVFRHFVATLSGSETFPSLRVIRFGGERVLARDVEAYRRHFPDGCLLYTGMGATETGHIRHCFLDRRTPVAGSVVPTGYAVEGKEVFLLDDAGRAVPTGEVGEIAVRSRYLALGYWRKPEATRAAFLECPDGRAERVFRTGDLGRMHPDGCLEHMGRKDFQVKVRGHRIEVAEVESALLALPGIGEAVVLAREEAPGEQRLVAYVVPQPGHTPAAADLRALLRDHLPDHMVPSAFVVLDRLPLTPNGKVDRLALPAPARAAGGKAQAAVAPRDRIEEVLAGLWAGTLGLEQVGLADDFFELGGHSLLATRVLARLRDALGVDLPLRALFDHPTVASLAEVVRSAEPATAGPAASPFARAPREGDLPLTFTQERLWFLHELDPESRAYHVPASLRFRGPLDPGALQDALTEIVRRHEVLRTTFPAVDGRPVQRVHPPWPVRLQIESLEAVPEPEREAELDRRIAGEIRKPFDLNRLPLVRWVVWRLGPEDHVFLRVEHHLLCDGWSFHLFVRELLAVYAAFSAGRPSPLPEPPLQLADFAGWQREWVRSPAAALQLEYWKARLAGGSPPLELPADRPRPKLQTFRGTSLRITLPAPLCASLRRRSRERGGTLFMTMLAAFLALLARYTGRSDVAVGSVVANRRWRETEGMMGAVLNTVVLRADLSGDPTVRELLDRVRDLTLEAHAHQDLPFERVVEAVQPERTTNYAPLCRVMFNFHDAPLVGLRLGGTRVELTELIDNRSAKFDLNLIVLPLAEQRVGEGAADDERIVVNWEYATDLFDAVTVERMAEHYRELLEGIAADPDRRISELPLLTDDERRRVLQDWNATAREYPRDDCVHRLFEAQADATPDMVALVHGEERVTYRELDRRANRMARCLRGMGVGPEVRVGVALERSAELVAALLAVLKAGGAYVALDPGGPERRDVQVLADAGVTVLVADGPHSGIRAAEIRVLDLSADRARIAAAGPERLPDVACAENLAYVCYTSGSTGSPKGVAVPHRAVVRLVKGSEYARLGPEEVMLQSAPVAFDASTFEIWGALLSGARLVIAPPGALSLADLGRTIRECGVTTLWLTAGLFHRVVEESLDDLRGVRQLLAGGDVLSVPHVRRVLDRLPDCRLVNGYGPTEGTTFTCCWPVPRPLPASCGSLPIGGPIANTRVYVLDPALDPVPIGVPGELYLGGDGLARGYLGRPGLTASRFVPDSFGGEPGSRLYRTGDRVRWLADGALEFLGRLDRQVKVRGFRVEPAEVEAALSEHPGVREAAVVARADSRGEARLLAYVVPRDGGAPAAADLREFLGSRLPAYMVPSAFAALAALPLTPSGKLDRDTLPEVVPADGDGLDGVDFVPPRTMVETALAAIYAEVVEVSRIGVHDDFFALGGDSLQAMRVVSRIRSRLGVDVPLLRIFEGRTVAALAEAVERARGGP